MIGLDSQADRGQRVQPRYEAAEYHDSPERTTRTDTVTMSRRNSHRSTARWSTGAASCAIAQPSSQGQRAMNQVGVKSRRGAASKLTIRSRTESRMPCSWVTGSVRKSCTTRMRHEQELEHDEIDPRFVVSGNCGLVPNLHHRFALRLMRNTRRRTFAVLRHHTFPPARDRRVSPPEPRA